ISGAIERYAMESQLQTGDTATVTQLVSGGYLKSAPSCPASGAYAASQTVGTDPVCPGTVTGHVLP
ncbi:MAG: hypothetical protein V1764_05450, partial [Nitrospirota bacterium]